MTSIQDLFTVEGLSVVITGGASGIGRGYAEALAANGARVTMFDLDRDALDLAVAELRATGGDVHGAQVDVTQASELAKAMQDVAQSAGKIDVVIANAGISGGPGFATPEGDRPEERMFEHINVEMLDKVLAVNIGATFRTIQAAVPHLKAAGGGRIIVTSSISASTTELLVGAAYVASKGGVGMLVRQAARELARYGILVNAISPGPVVTNIGGGRLRDASARAPFDAAAPLGRIGTPQDMAGAAIFLSSPASAHITGAEIIIDGGACLGPDRPSLPRIRQDQANDK